MRLTYKHARARSKRCAQTLPFHGMLDASYPASSLSTILVPKFAQLDEFCTRLASFLPNICVITLTIFLSLLGGIMTHDARKDWRDLCREAVAESDPAKLIAIVNELNRELDEEKKKKAAVFLQKIDKKRA